MGKKPYLLGWTSSPPESDRVIEELNRDPKKNLGVITGNGLLALDVDMPEKVGFDPRPAIEKGALAHTTSKAPRLVFGYRNFDIASYSIVDDETKKKMVELLGPGRQFMAPPSVHPDTGQVLEWITPIEGKMLVVKSQEELRQLLLPCFDEKWVVDELLWEKREPPRASYSQQLFERVVNHLRPRLVRESGRWFSFLCPFHPDKHPSFALNKEKCYAIDYHDDRVFNIKELAEELGVIRKRQAEGFSIRPYAEIIKEAGQIEWHSEPLLPKGGLVVLAGKAGVGKSFACLQLAHDVASGTPIFGHFPCKSSRVLIIDEESDPRLHKQRCRVLEINPPGNMYALIKEGFRIDCQEDLDWLDAYLEKNDGFGFIVLDSWTDLIHRTDENYAIEVNNVLSELQRLSLKHNLTFLLVHHLRKGLAYAVHEIDELRGSSVLLNKPDVVLLMQAGSKPEEKTIRIIKNRFGEPIAFGLKFQRVGDKLKIGYCETAEASVAPAEPDVVRCAKVIKGFLEMSGPGEYRRKQLEASASGFSRRAIQGAIALLKANNTIERVRRGVYRYPAGGTQSLLQSFNAIYNSKEATEAIHKSPEHPIKPTEGSDGDKDRTCGVCGRDRANNWVGRGLGWLCDECFEHGGEGLIQKILKSLEGLAKGTLVPKERIANAVEISKDTLSGWLNHPRIRPHVIDRGSYVEVK